MEAIFNIDPADETDIMTVHYEVREQSLGKLRAIHRACKGLKNHYDTDTQSADPRDVNCHDCLSWLSLVLKDRKKKPGGKK